jgi:hypothetical protein
VHIGAIVLIALIVLACQGPAAVMRAVMGLGCLLLIAAVLLALLLAISQTQNHSTTSLQPAPSISPQ